MSIASTLGVTEGAVRYRERRMAVRRTDGRIGRQEYKAAEAVEPIERWVAARGNEGGLNLAALHEHLVAGYTGSLRSVQRYVRHGFLQRGVGRDPGRDSARGPGAGGLGAI